MRRIPAPELTLEVGSTVELSDDRGRYVRDVLRLDVGARVELFDGSGTVFVGSIVELDPVRVELSSTRDASDVESPCEITLYQALPKGDRFELVLQKATELGAARIVPIETERTVVRIPRRKQKSRRERWGRIVESAARQCGRAVIPSVATPSAFADALENATRQTEWFLDARGGLPPAAAAPSGSSAAIWIGPEGGFTDREREALTERAAAITLGPRILRTETAAIAALTLMQHLSGGLE